MKAAAHARHVPTSVSPIRLWTEDAVGYRPDDDVPDWQRLTVKVAVAAGAAIAFAFTMWMLNRGELPRTPENTLTMLRLADFTKTANPSVLNTMPAFLALPGAIGQVSSDATSIKAVDENSLRAVICAPSVAVLVRQEFPGHYDRMPDDRLEAAVLEKHPEYRDKLCSLPAWMDATPQDIVKYQMKPLSPIRTAVILPSFVAALVFVLGLLNLYYRVLVPHAERVA